MEKYQIEKHFWSWTIEVSVNSPEKTFAWEIETIDL